MRQTRGRLIAHTVLLIVLWGFTWPILKIGLHFAPPLLFAGIRTLMGGLVLVIVSLLKRRSMHLAKLWHIYLILAIFNVILYFGLQNIALMYLSSGLLSVLVYLQPILVAFLAWIWLKESFPTSKIIGILAGFIGVIIISGKGFASGVSVLGIILAILTAVSWAIGTVYWKSIQGQVDPLWGVAIPFTIGGVILTISGSLTEHWGFIHWVAPLIGSLLYTSLLGTALAWVLWFRLVDMAEVSVIAPYTFFVPLLSVVIGVVWLHEKINSTFIIGFVVIALGIYLVNRRANSEELTE